MKSADFQEDELSLDKYFDKNEDRKPGNFLGVDPVKSGGFRAKYSTESGKQVRRRFRSERLAALWRDRAVLREHKKKTNTKKLKTKVRLNFPCRVLQTWKMKAADFEEETPSSEESSSEESSSEESSSEESSSEESSSEEEESEQKESEQGESEEEEDSEPAPSFSSLSFSFPTTVHPEHNISHLTQALQQATTPEQRRLAWLAVHNGFRLSTARRNIGWTLIEDVSRRARLRRYVPGRGYVLGTAVAVLIDRVTGYAALNLLDNGEFEELTRAELKDARAAFYDEVWVDPLEAESDAYIVPREGMTFGRIAADIREQFRQQLSAADLIRWNASVSGQRVTKNARFKQGTRIWYIVQ